MIRIFGFVYCCWRSHLSVSPSTARKNMYIFPQTFALPLCCAMKTDSFTKWTGIGSIMHVLAIGNSCVRGTDLTVGGKRAEAEGCQPTVSY